jgi:hypothetical protein
VGASHYLRLLSHIYLAAMRTGFEPVISTVTV